MNETKPVKPNTLPFKCPNCNGYGTVGLGTRKRPCHSCGGVGVIFVPQIIKEDENAD